MIPLLFHKAMFVESKLQHFTIRFWSQYISFMNLNLLGNRYFWAVVLITIGSLLTLGQVLSFSIPLFRILVTTILVTAGLQLVLKSVNIQPVAEGQPSQTVLLGAGEKQITAANLRNRYYTVLGSHILDFRNLTLTASTQLEVNTLMGEVHLYLPEVYQTYVRSTTFLGSDKGTEGLGEFSTQNRDVPSLIIDAHTVLGSLTVHRNP